MRDTSLKQHLHGEMVELCNTQQDNEPGASEFVKRRIAELPLDIHHYIIGFLDNRICASAIANCSLVCRAWLPFSRFKLYYMVHIRYRRQWTLFRHLMISTTTPSSIIQNLRTVRRLCIWPWDLRSQPWKRRAALEQPWAHTILFECAAHLTGLMHLELLDVHFGWARIIHMVPRDANLYRSLTTLSLVHCTFTDALQLILFVASFPVLSELVLSSVGSQSLAVPSNIPKAGHTLSHFALLGGDDAVWNAISQWLVRAELVCHLAQLNWSPRETAEAEEGWTIISGAINGPALQKLICTLCPSSQVDLSRFTCITVINLHYEPMAYDEVWESLRKLVSSISSNRLEELCVKANNGWEGQSLDSMLSSLPHLSDIDGILSRPQFCHLHQVKLELKQYIFIQDVPTSFNTSLSSSEGVADPYSSAQPNVVDGLVKSEDKSVALDQDDLAVAFADYTEQLVRLKIEENLGRISSRGVLEIQLSIEPTEQSPDIVSGDGNAEAW